MTPAHLRSAARALAAGRVALGTGLVVAPVALGKPWLGDFARAPGGKVALRALGVRDVMLGGIALHVVDRAAASRALQTNAAADLVDAGVTLAARRALPPTAAGVVGLAGGGAVSGILLARRLAREVSG